MMRRQRWSALVAVLAILASIPLLGQAAHACSCGPPTIDEALHNGDAIAVVTRTDHNSGTDATFRVERALGADLPGTVTGQVDEGMSCRPQIFPEQVAGVILHRGTTWLLKDCSQEDLAETLTRVEGRKLEESARDPIAVVGGNFGDSSLAELDKNGAIVAWDERPGITERLAVCPGFVALSAIRVDEQNHRELTVLTGDTLYPQFSVPLTIDQYEAIAGLRCDGPIGGTNHVLIAGHPGTGTTGARLLTITGTKAASRRVLDDELSSAVPIRGGFLAEVGRFDGPQELRRIANDGSVSTLPLHARLYYDEELSASHDGRSVAFVGYDSIQPKGNNPPEASIFIIDSATGHVLAQRRIGADPGVQLAWTDGGKLLARFGYDVGYTKSYSTGTVHLFNNLLRELAAWPGGPGGGLAAVGDSAVTFGGGRMTAIPTQGAARTFDNLWLTQAGQIASLGQGSFAPGTGEPAAATPDVVKAVSSLPTNSTDDPAPYVLGGLAVIVAGILIGRRLATRGPR